jgi:hypothetical protein
MEAPATTAAAAGWRKRLLALFASMMVVGLIVGLSVAFAPDKKRGTALVPGTGATISDNVCLGRWWVQWWVCNGGQWYNFFIIQELVILSLSKLSHFPLHIYIYIYDPPDTYRRTRQRCCYPSERQQTRSVRAYRDALFVVSFLPRRMSLPYFFLKSSIHLSHPISSSAHS